MNESAMIEEVEIVFAVEGHERHFAAKAGPEMRVAEFAGIAAKAFAIDGVLEVFLEDSEEPLEGHLLLIETLSARFAPLHVGRPGAIKTTVEYNGRKVERAFRPSVTIARIIVWAIGKDGLNLEGGPADYQLKYKGHVLSPDLHLGQIARGQKQVELDLVFKIKPQG